MQYRLFTPLRIVIALFACAFLLVVFVAVYQARRGPFMRQEEVRANEVRRVLQQAGVDPAASDGSIGSPPAVTSSQTAALAINPDSLVEEIDRFTTQTQERFPYPFSLALYTPSSFPECMAEEFTREITRARESMEQTRNSINNDVTWLDGYDKGKLKLPVLAEMSESERAELRARRQQELETSRERVEEFCQGLEALENRLSQVRDNPEDVWSELYEYFQGAKVLHDVEERLRLSPETLPPEACELHPSFTYRAVLETHAARLDAALASFDVARDLLDRCYLAKRPGAPQPVDSAPPSLYNGDNVLQYIVNAAPLNTQQRTFLLDGLSRRDKTDRVSEAIRVLAAKEERTLDMAEMAQLKLDSANATAYRSPFEIAERVAPILDNSPEDGLHALVETRNEIRTLSTTAYASSSPSFLGPKGRLVRYLGYVTSPHTRLDPDKNKPPAVVITAKFVEKAISLVENHLRAVFMSDLTRTALALKDFKAAHGQYPNKLEDAIPEFLPKVPIVPWTGQPIVYTAPDPVSGAGFALSSDVRSWPNLRDTLWSAAR